MFKSRSALQRQHARDLDRLLAVIERQNDRIMHLAGRPWDVAPADMPSDPEPGFDYARYSYNPEQDPDA